MEFNIYNSAMLLVWGWYGPIIYMLLIFLVVLFLIILS